jgi:CDP-diacylglycerol--glycerol-3-phosphate 3-phosphatidyltransferase
VYFAQISGAKYLAVGIYALASITDVLDGIIARRCNCITNLGKILDPIGDKMMCIAVLVCLTVDRLIPVWVVIVVCAKEVMLICGGALARNRSAGFVQPSNFLGKAATAAFFIVCVGLMVFGDYLAGTPANILISLAVLLTLTAFAGYAVKFVRILKK